MKKAEIANELLARIFMIYWGCQFKYNGSVGIVRVVSGITRNWGILDGAGGQDGNDSYRPDKCKLFLKDLSHITEEDAMRVAEILYPLSNLGEDAAKVYYGRMTIWFHICNYSWDSDNVHDTAQSRKDITEARRGMYFIYAADYLRSKGYMLPFMGIDLFEAGIAIKTTK